MPRPDWTTYFLGLASLAASRSTCAARPSGAVIVRDRMVVATGYRDTPAGLRNCGEGGCDACRAGGAPGAACRCICAEQNAIVQAAYHGIALRGGTLYCTHQPCLACAKLIVNVGIAKVYYRETVGDPEAVRILQDAKVSLIKV
jgi:dCMP deaminase